jgi:outer membrane receptor protein involved in Fe transport
MTPFPEREHNETLEQGDAELLPELTDLVELGLVGNFGDNSVFATAYYRRTRDVINRVNTVYNDTILNRIYTNVGDASAVGLELGLTVFPVSDWRIYLGGNVYNYGIEGEVFGDRVDVSNWVYSLSATSDVRIPDWVDVQLGINYLGERVTAQGRDSRFFNPYLNLRRAFAEQRLTLSLQWQNISLGLWDANEQRITTERPDFFTTTNYLYETDILRLGISYQLTARKRAVAGPRSEFGEEEF